MVARQWKRRRARAFLAGGLACWLAACTLTRAPETRPLRAEDRPVESFEVRLWRAGRSLSPGLSAARRSELEDERARAVEQLAATLRSADEQRWKSWLGGADTPDELWCTAARAAAALERYDLAPLLAPALEPAASARRAVAGQEALHTLYGRWFRRPSELTPFRASVTASPGTRLLLASLAAEEERSRERLLGELAHDPASAEAWLTDPDPVVRSGAARSLAQVFARDGESTEATLGVLIGHLESEQEPSAFHEALQACIAPLERMPAEESASARLRALLIDVARVEGEPRTLSAAQALVRLPWRKDGARDLGHVLTGVEALGAMVRGLGAADRRRGVNDPDALVVVLFAMRELCVQASALGWTAELRAGSARASLLAILGDAQQDDAVRSAAAAALGPLARAADGPELAAVLSDPAVGTQVKHAVLGAVSAVLTELGPGNKGSEELLAALVEQSGARDADLRRRALSLLADERLEPLVRGLDPVLFVERLGAEDGHEATLELLRLIQRFGHADCLDELLALERFDALCSEPLTLEAMAAALQQLTAQAGKEASTAAARLVAVRSESTALARHQLALHLVAAMDEAAALDLAPEAQRAISAWVWRVVSAGVASRDLTPLGVAFEQRVLDVHLPRGGASGWESAQLSTAERAHLTALLRADVFLGAGASGRGTKQQVEAAYESALSLAQTEDVRWRLLRDRARFRAAANECVKALSDYRRLLEVGVRADPLLGVPDLRSAVELLNRLEETGGPSRSATAGEACAILGRLIARPVWRSEPASVRMQDLREWVRAALESSELDSLRRVDALLADLPLTQLETQIERDPVPIWFGLTREASWFQELLDLRVRARLGLRALEAQG